MSRLIVLTADRNMKAAVTGILSRPKAIGTADLTWSVHPYVGRADPGVLRQAHAFLHPFVNQFSHALCLFDRHGCGRESVCREELEQEVERNLAANGWADRSAAIAIDPELEVWLWADSPHVPAELGWTSSRPDLKLWLRDRGYWREGSTKPERPKEAVEAVLREVRRPRSSALYAVIAAKVSFERCTDPAFIKLKTTLQTWFPTDPAVA